MLQAGNGWLIATLGEGQEKEREEDGGKEEKQRERERGGDRAAGERARPAATFQRVIIVISLGGLDSVVPSRQTERKKDGNYRKMRGERKRRKGVMERSG